jgi:hypothetical protein
MSEEKKPAAKKPAATGRVFDVSRPGKAPASPTSKPVIVGHKPEAQQAQTSVSGIGAASPLLTKRKISIMPGDDSQAKPEAAAPAMVVPEDFPAGAPPPKEEEALAVTASEPTAASPPALPGQAEAEQGQPSDKPKLVIQPSEGADAAAETAPETETTPAEPAAEPPAEPESEPETQPEPAAQEEELAATQASEPPKPAETESVEPVTPGPLSTTSSVPETENRAEEVIPGQAEELPPPKIDPLFDDSGHIVVSQHHHRRHSLKVVVLLLVILLLAVAAVDLLLDLGLLTAPGLPRTDFFSN